MAAAVLPLVLAGCGTEAPVGAANVELTDKERSLLARLGPLGDPPPSPTNRWADDPAARAFGQALFFDERMSGDGAVSCATCHAPDHGFADPLPLSLGAYGREGTRHASTLVNVAWNRFQFWDGRADSLWAQPIQAIENPLEGDFSRTELAHFIASTWRETYEPIFGTLPDLSGVPARARPGDPAWEAMTEEDRMAVNRITANVGKALEAYMRLLVFRDSPLDRFLDGDESALSAAALRGAKVFVDVDRGFCILCHDGPNLTDNGFHNIGIPDSSGDTGRLDAVPTLLADPLNGDGPFSDAPGGRLAGIAQGEVQRGAFKTPTLRNVSQRPPYGHNGAIASLEEFIDFHDAGGGPPGSFTGQKEETVRALGLTAEEKADLLAFLKALDGAPLPRELVTPPPGLPGK